MDSFERQGIWFAVAAHVVLAGSMGAAFLFSMPVEAEPPPPVEVSIAGMGDAMEAGALDANPDAGVMRGEETITPPPEDEVVEEVAEPESESVPEPAPIVKPKPDTSAADKAKADRAAREKAAADKKAADRSAKDKAAREKATRDKAAKDKAAADKAAQDRAARDKATRDKAARDKAAKDKAAADKAARDKTARDKAAKDKAAADKAARDKAARDKAAKDKAARDKSARDKAAADKAARDKAAADAKKGKQPSGRLNGIGSGKSGTGSNSGSAAKPAAEVRQAASASIGNEVRPHLRACAPSGVGVSDLRVFVSLSIGKDGSLQSATVYDVKGVNASNQSQVEPMKRCALQAVKKASPFKLDPDGYDVWKTHKIQLKPN